MIQTIKFFYFNAHSGLLPCIKLLSVTRIGVMLSLLMLSCNHVANASSNAQRIIDRSIAAYGADTLINMQSLTLKDTLYQFAKGQSGHVLQGESIAYFNQQQTELAIDFGNRRTAFRRATRHLVGGHASDQPVLVHRLFRDNNGVAIDHALQEVRTSNYISSDNVTLNYHYMLDTLIVLELVKHRSSVSWLDVAYIQGKAHDVITYTPSTNRPVTLYIDQQTGLIKRVVRHSGDNVFSYDYLQHQYSQGVSYASHVFVGANQQPLYHLSARELGINDASDNSFAVPQHYQPSADKAHFDVSELSIRELKPDVYFVGKEWGYTLFVDLGDGYLSAGAWQEHKDTAAWKNALALLRETTGNNKPVIMHLVTHHHLDHMMALDDIASTGAALIVHPSYRTAVEAHLSNPIPKEQLIDWQKAQALLADRIKLIDVPNSHANHNLALLLPQEQIIFTEDIFGSSYRNAFHSPANWPDGDTYERLDVLMASLGRLKLDFEYFLSSHHGRILSQNEIKQALAVKREPGDTLLKRLFQTQSE